MPEQKLGKQPIFVDDDPNFIETVKHWQNDYGLKEYATEDIEESLNMVRKGDADIFICDLKMPAQDGISVLQRVRKIDPNIELIMLTGYELTDEQKKIVEGLGGKVCLKYDKLEELLDSLVKGTGEKESTNAIHLQTRVSKLEHLNRVWTGNLVRDLQEIKGLKDAWVSSVGDNFTVEQLIKDIQDCNERGIKHIKLWLGVQERLQSIGVRIRRRAK